jgi:release factor glutamine methyltransferase
MAGKFAESEWMAGTWLAVEAVTGIEKKDLIARPNLEIQTEKAEKLQSIFDRMQKEEPIQYILGQSYFRYLKIKVNPAVLIPRQETEWLVDLVLAKVLNSEAVGVDVCTGSGCIALSLATERPKWKMSGLDFEENALEVAKENNVNTKGGVNFFHDNALNLKHKPQPLSLDFIVSNPPYVPYSQADEVENQVKMFEPESAVFVDGDDSILFYKTIFNQYLSGLKNGGWFFFEIHPTSEQLLQDFLSSFLGIKFWFEKDFKNLTRFLMIQKQII